MVLMTMPKCQEFPTVNITKNRLKLLVRARRMIVDAKRCAQRGVDVAGKDLTAQVLVGAVEIAIGGMKKSDFIDVM